MMLADYEIEYALGEGTLQIDPWEPPVLQRARGATTLQPASVDVRLDKHFQVLTAGKQPINPASDPAELFRPMTIEKGALQLAPGECVLGSTYERVQLPNDITGHVHGKSSLGRLFLLVHATAGLLDAGWGGHITLELVNLGPRPLLLWPGMKIAQLTFHRMSGTAVRPYGAAELGSHYQDQPRGPVLPQGWRNFAHGLPGPQEVLTA